MVISVDVRSVGENHYTATFDGLRLEVHDGFKDPMPFGWIISDDETGSVLARGWSTTRERALEIMMRRLRGD